MTPSAGLRWASSTAVVLVVGLTACTSSTPAPDAAPPPSPTSSPVSTPVTPSPKPTPSPSRKATPSPTPKATLSAAFCGTLDVLNLAVLRYSAEAGKVLQNPQAELDVTELKRVAGLVAQYGAELRPLAPPAARRHLDVVTKATAESARNLRPGARVITIVDPMYRATTQAARDRLDGYSRPPHCPL